MSTLPQPSDHSSLARQKAIETLEKLDELLNSLDEAPRELEKQNAYLRSALSYISEGRGPRDRDPLKHADNCIKEMTQTAIDALAGTWEKDA